MTISKIEIIPIREAFTHEAHNFTVWLENNIDALSDRLGFKLTVEEREKSVGSFNVDLLCIDERGEFVIIENQLERTDHTHLGQLLTYLVNLNAKVAIWVATEIRPEHERVIDWLNEMTSEDIAFFAVKVEAIRIGTSPYAPLFTIMAQPDEQTRQIGQAKKEQAKQNVLLTNFWINLQKLSQGKIEDFDHITPRDDYGFGSSAGLRSVWIGYSIFRDYYGGQIYIDSGEQEYNKAVFDFLYENKAQIEEEIGYQLDWKRLEAKRASRVRFIVLKPEGYDFNNPDTWDTLHTHMIDAMIPFNRAMRKYLKKVKI
jgi:hypothetical protein